MTRWDKFWFPAGARLSLGAARIAVSMSVLWSLKRLYEPDFAALLAKKPVELYDPVGILRLLGSGVPSAGLLAAIQIIAWVATIAMLLGLASRVSTVVSLVTALALASFQVSFAPGWHHTYPLVFLAQIPLVFAPVGDSLSADNLIRRLRGRTPPQRGEGAYAWGIRLVQFGVALVFFNAFIHKLLQGHFSLAWALSDNLRHQLLMRFDWVGNDRTALADWLLQSPLRYKTAALMNLIAQLLPFIACFLWRRPVLRFLFGVLIVFETMGIALVMNMWNMQWIPAAAVFVDWDRLVPWIRRRLRRRSSPPERAPVGHHDPMPQLQRRRLTAWIAVYLGMWLVIGFAYPPIDQKANLFPFSRFPMFSPIRAKKPYDAHLSYEVLGTRLEIDSTPPIDERKQAWINRQYGYRWLHRITDPARLKVRLESAAGELTRNLRLDEVRSVRLWLTVFQAPAYPAKAEFIEHRIAISGQWDRDGEFVSYLGPVRVAERARGTLDPAQPVPAEARFAYHADDDPTSVPLELERVGNQLHYRGVEGNTQVFVALVRQTDGGWLPFTLMRAPKFGW